VARFERVKDKWKDLRKDLYGNVEPEVTLEAITMPIKMGLDYPRGPLDAVHQQIINKDVVTTPCIKGFNFDFQEIEKLPALAAGVSYGTKDKLENDSDKAIQLNKKLIKMGHLTPLESIQINFGISGISKACGAQISRHRIGQGHTSVSRRYKEAEPYFVYPALGSIDDESEALQMLKNLEAAYDEAFADYSRFRDIHNSSGYKHVMKKEDARLVLPISYATERTWWVNVRALRDFFRLRLAADAEWEIRRLAWMMYDIVVGLLPSLFEDLTNEPKTTVARSNDDDTFHRGMLSLLSGHQTV
jgi:thymidylate synthase (FAD)